MCVLSDQIMLERIIKMRVRSEQRRKTAGVHDEDIWLPEVVNCDAEQQSILFSFTAKPWMKNYAGMLWGGITAALMEQTLGMLSSALYGEVETPCIALNIIYSRPVPCDDPINIRGRVLYAGGTTAQLSAEVFSPNLPDTVLVSATSITHTRRAVAAANESTTSRRS